MYDQQRQDMSKGYLSDKFSIFLVTINILVR